MQFDNIIKKRKSVRDFKKLKKALWKDILEAIDAANQGPLAGNINTLKFIIIEEPSTIKELAKHAHQSFISQAGIVVVICSDDTHLEKLYGERGRVYNKQQAGAAIMTFLLKLVDIGLSSCWVGAFEDEITKSILKIPEHIQIEAIIPIGYEKKVPGKNGKKRKRALENAILWEDWKTKKRPALFKEHPEEPSEID